jgi:thiol-disulfide isomerase/thioredoxin
MNKRTISLFIIIIVIAGAIYFFESMKVQVARIVDTGQSDIILDKKQFSEQKAKKYETAKEISTPDGFINTKNITIQENIGKKVILIDFWTYSCINCQRTTPYLNAWHQKYSDNGLVILGVHTPEFEFEKDYDNVQAAVDRFDIKYPVILDNDFSTWRAYKNRYWPRKYLIDIDGYIVYDHIGEGGYEATEKKIQELLEERMEALGMAGSIDKDISDPSNVEVPSSAGPRTPEIYFGSLRNERLGNGTPGKSGEQSFVKPAEFSQDFVYLEGDWDITNEYAQNLSADAKIIIRYQAEKVFMVAESDSGTDAKIFKDGALLKNIDVETSSLYRLIEDPNNFGQHLLEIEIKDPGLRAYTFTFG